MVAFSVDGSSWGFWNYKLSLWLLVANSKIISSFKRYLKIWASPSYLHKVITGSLFYEHNIPSTYLSVLIHLRVRIVRNGRRVKEVEEAICLDLLGDGPHAALALVLLFLLDLLHCEVLPLTPVYGAARALEDLRTLPRSALDLVFNKYF